MVAHYKTRLAATRFTQAYVINYLNDIFNNMYFIYGQICNYLVIIMYNSCHYDKCYHVFLIFPQISCHFTQILKIHFLGLILCK